MFLCLYVLIMYVNSVSMSCILLLCSICIVFILHYCIQMCVCHIIKDYLLTYLSRRHSSFSRYTHTHTHTHTHTASDSRTHRGVSIIVELYLMVRHLGVRFTGVQPVSRFHAAVTSRPRWTAFPAVFH